MSELVESIPSFTSYDASNNVFVNRELAPVIDFEMIAGALSLTDTDLEYRDRDHYLQELRIIEITLTRLDLAKDYLGVSDYGNCRSQFEAIIDLVRPTGNEVLVALLQNEHDKLYR